MSDKRVQQMIELHKKSAPAEDYYIETGMKNLHPIMANLYMASCKIGKILEVPGLNWELERTLDKVRTEIDADPKFKDASEEKVKKEIRRRLISMKEERRRILEAELAALQSDKTEEAKIEKQPTK